jgi:hypothetical protein
MASPFLEKSYSAIRPARCGIVQNPPRQPKKHEILWTSAAGDSGQPTSARRALTSHGEPRATYAAC